MSVADLFGELYLRSTKPFLPAVLTDAEVSFLRERLPTGLVLDLGCGHGRHLRQLGPSTVGLDADPISLGEAKAFGPVAQGDFEKLPFRTGVFRGAYAWYNTLGTFEAEALSCVVAELGRCLGPEATLIIQGTNPGRARAAPEATFEGTLPDGSLLRETTRWVEALGRDEVHRTLTLADGCVMSASFFIRYYEQADWSSMLGAAGLVVDWACGGIDGSPVGVDSLDVIVGAHKRG